MAIISASHAVLEDGRSLDFRMFKRFRFPPPNLRRGRCRNCGQAFVETWSAGPLKVLFIPAMTFERPEQLPAVGADIFYERHVAEAIDDAPKHTGYLPSQMAIVRLILGAM